MGFHNSYLRGFSRFSYCLPARQTDKGWNPCLIAKVLWRGLKYFSKTFILWVFQSVLTDFSYETGVKTPGGLWDKRENDKSLLELIFNC
jgi:hypothetical protein